MNNQKRSSSQCLQEKQSFKQDTYSVNGKNNTTNLRILDNMFQDFLELCKSEDLINPKELNQLKSRIKDIYQEFQQFKKISEVNYFHQVLTILLQYLKIKTEFLFAVYYSKPRCNYTNQMIIQTDNLFVYFTISRQNEKATLESKQDVVTSQKLKSESITAEKTELNNNKNLPQQSSQIKQKTENSNINQQNSSQSKSSNEKNNKSENNQNDRRQNLPINLSRGLPNIGATCYINSAIQALRQIYYQDQTIFELSSFGKHLREIFILLDSNHPVEDMMRKMFAKSIEQQKHKGGGDSYFSVINFIEAISESLNEETYQIFEQKFIIQYEDQLHCRACKKMIMVVTEFEEVGIECSSLQYIFTRQSDPYKTKPCSDCKQYQLFLYRKFINAPQFLLVKVPSPYNKSQFRNDFEYINQTYSCEVNQQKISYKIIGFCNYYHNHYTYTALYNNQWIEFDDLTVKKVSPNNQNAIYYLLTQRS